MTSSTSFARAIAVDVRDTLTSERLGIALVLPSERRLWMLTDGAGSMLNSRKCTLIVCATLPHIG